jgi:hypothetical protein
VEFALFEAGGRGMTEHGAAIHIPDPPPAGTLLRARVTGQDGTTLSAERL